MQEIELSAGTVRYRITGPENGPPVVFVHGFLVDHGLWGEVPERLADRGFRCVAPTWPLGAHRPAMRPGADLSPRGMARLVAELVAALDLGEVTLVGNDTGGAICQFVLDEDPSGVGRVVLTNCDAFDTFPPFPFGALFWAARHPALGRGLMLPMRAPVLRNGLLGFGPLAQRRLSAAETKPWVTPYLGDAEVRRDVATFARAARAADLADVATRLQAFDRPVLLCWAPKDRFFRISLARRLAQTFPNARLVEVPDARTFLPLDQPARLAQEIAAFVNG